MQIFNSEGELVEQEMVDCAGCGCPVVDTEAPLVWCEDCKTSLPYGPPR